MNKKIYTNEENLEDLYDDFEDDDLYEDELDEEEELHYYVNIKIEEYELLFYDVIRKRGEDYYKKGNVKKVFKQEDNYIATVRGSETYEVNVQIEDDVIKGIRCDCKYFETNYGPCKHVYAVIKKIINNEYDEIYVEPEICPNCKSNEHVIPIAYGKITKKLQEKIEKNRVVYGGEKRESKIFNSYSYFKKWHCKKCDLDILNTGELNIPPAFEYIGKDVKVIIDRKLGSKHPKWEFIYPLNYGYIPNTVSGDNEELDAYVLGQFEPLEKFEGTCIAVIHRTNDNDDKLVVVDKDKFYSNDQIRALTEFQERFFSSEIIR